MSDSDSSAPKYKAKDLRYPYAHAKYRKENGLGPHQEAGHIISNNTIAQAANIKEYPYEKRAVLKKFANRPENFETVLKSENRRQIPAENNMAKNLKKKAESSHKDSERNAIRDKGAEYVALLKKEGAPQDVYAVIALANQGYRS